MCEATSQLETLGREERIAETMTRKGFEWIESVLILIA